MSIALSRFFEETYAPLRLSLASSHTVFQYRTNIRRFSEWIGRDATVLDLTDDAIAKFCARLLANGRQPATANKVLTQLRALWEFAARRGLRRDFPTIRKMPEYRRSPVAWSKEQLRTLFSALRRERGRIGGIPASVWWIGLHAVLWDTGARIGAVLELRWEDLDWERGQILLRAETQKQRADQRFKLHPDTLAFLTLMRRGSGLMFPWPTCRSCIWYRYNRILQAAGLPCDRRSKFHRMRKSVASWFKACGGNATDLLGHSSPRVTEAYLDEAIIGKPQACDLLFRPWAGW